MPLRRAALACHVLLILALAASLVPPASALRLAAAALLALPLLLTLRGLAAARRAVLQRLAVLLVAYIGGFSIEVVARSGESPAANGALIVAALELGLALALIRRTPTSA
jgi:hypothetical protein